MTIKVESRAVAGSALVLTRPGTAAPGSIDATAQLDDAGLTVSLRIRVDPGGVARVVQLNISPLAAIVRVIERADGGGTVPPGAITSRAVRGIRLDELAREALRQQERPAASDPELAASAARVYAEAVKAGSRAPTVAVANALGQSRSQASRLIRQARDDGALPGTRSRSKGDGALSGKNDGAITAGRDGALKGSSGCSGSKGGKGK